MKNLTPLLSLFLTIIILRLLQPVITKFLNRTGAQERRLAKAKLPSWLRSLEVFLFVTFLALIIILVLPLLIVGKSGTITSVFDVIEIVLVFCSAVPAAGLLSNIILWIIPTTRKITSENAKGVPGLSFKEANYGLIKLILIVLGLWVIFLGIKSII